MFAFLDAFLEKKFGLTANGTTPKRELIAGFTTFLAMAYITVVNPDILSDAGMDFGAVFVATCIAAAVGTLMMGVIANYPVAMAPGMGQNAFFAYTVVLGMGHTWQQALGAVAMGGFLFVVLSLFPVREWLINAIPRSLKLGISAGIGFFLAIIAFRNGGIVISDMATLVTFGDFMQPQALLMMGGFILIAALTARNVMGAVVIGMLVVTVIGWITGIADFRGVMSMPPSMAPVFMQLEIGNLLDLSMITVILTILLVDIFDTAGTLVGVASQAGMLDAHGKLPRLRQALLADSTATMLGGFIGTSSTTSYIESAAGVQAGGRTGLTAVVTGTLFLLCLFLSPLAQSIPGYATGAALLFVACLMGRSLQHLIWDDITELAPAILTALAMPFGYSISDGIGVGFISYAGIKLVAGKGRDCPTTVYVIALIFALKFAFLD
jgi:AGZA family xanthine/uracil permease-like MFS transporter